MKKTGMMLVAGLLVTGALAQDVTSVNVVGFNKIEIGAGKWAMLTVPFESFGDSTIQDLIGNQLPDGSLAFIWDRVEKRFLTSARIKGTWTTSPVTMRGDAFWLRNAGTETAYVSLMGEVPAAYNNGATTTLEGLNAWDMIGYSYPVDVVWTNTTVSQQLADGALLFVWDTVSSQYSTFLKSKGIWTTPPGYTIPVGQGFWLRSPTEIDWTEEAPYNL